MTLDNDSLFTQLPGQPKFAVVPESETRFALQGVPAAIEFEKDASGAKAVPASIEFQLAADGSVTGLVLTQGGRSMPAPKQ